MKIKKLILPLFIIAIIVNFAIFVFATDYQYKYNPFTTKLDWVVADSELGGGSPPGLPDQSIQFNASSTFAGSSNLMWFNATNTLYILEGRAVIGAVSGVDPRTGLSIAGDFDVIHVATEADDHAVEIDLDAAGFGDIKALDIDYITGAIAAGEDEGIILINIDETDATGGDVFALEVLATDGSAGVYGLKVGALIGPVHQDSGVFVNPTTGTDNTPSTDVPAMIDGNTGTTTAIFENDNEYIIIGGAAAFEELEFILTVLASVNIKPTFWYSTTGAGQFTQFTPVDGTNGFRNTGVVAWDQSDLTGHTTNDDTGTYDIKIIRTKNNLATSPVLGYAKSAATTEYIWDKDGNLNVASLAANTVTGANVTSGADPGHTHGSGSITEVDPLAVHVDGTTPLTANWDVGNYDLTMKSLTMDGTFLLQSATDSTTAHQIKDNAGNIVFNVDSILERVTVGSDAGKAKFSIVGSSVALWMYDTDNTAYWGFGTQGGGFAIYASTPTGGFARKYMSFWPSGGDSYIEVNEGLVNVDFIYSGNTTGGIIVMDADTESLNFLDNVPINMGTTNKGEMYYLSGNLIIDPDTVGAGKLLIGATGDDDMLLNAIEIDGALNHDGSTAGFYGTVPITKPANTTDIKDVLVNLGLLTSGGATPLNLDGGTFTGVNVTSGVDPGHTHTGGGAESAIKWAILLN